jgi:hypothetical protein
MKINIKESKSIIYNNFNSNLMNSPLTLAFVSNIKLKHNNPMVIYKNNDVYEIIGEDADWCIENIGLSDISKKGECSHVVYICANQHITSKIIKLYQRGIAFVDEIPVGSVLQLSLF